MRCDICHRAGLTKKEMTRAWGSVNMTVCKKCNHKFNVAIKDIHLFSFKKSKEINRQTDCAK